MFILSGEAVSVIVKKSSLQRQSHSFACDPLENSRWEDNCLDARRSIPVMSLIASMVIILAVLVTDALIRCWVSWTWKTRWMEAIAEWCLSRTQGLGAHQREMSLL